MNRCIVLSRCRLLLSRHCSSDIRSYLARPFSTTAASDGHDAFQNVHCPVTVFTEDETLIRDTVREWARKDLLPVVREMDEDAQLKPEILSALFAQGFMGMEIDPQYGGSGLSFTSACLAVEEVSRVDPSVAILCKWVRVASHSSFAKVSCCQFSPTRALFYSSQQWIFTIL